MDKRKLGTVLMVVGVLLIITGFYLKPSAEAQQALEKETTVTETNQAVFVSTIAHKFNKKYFTHTENTNGFDLNMEFSYKNKKYPFSLICAYVNDLPQSLTWASREQFAAFNKQHTDRLAFLIVGSGGTAMSPQHIFIVPLEKLNSETVQLETLLIYKKTKADGKFYYDYKKGELR